MILDPVLILVGIIFLLRRLKVRRLTPGDFPEHEPEDVVKWLKTEASAVKTGLLATWGMFLVKTLILLVIYIGPRMKMFSVSDIAGVVIQTALYFVSVSALIVAVSAWFSARKVRRETGIELP